jgi:uncharacterized membrane protein YhaH (DUF805 family)
MFDYLRGRSGRKEYWISVAILVLLGLALAYFDVPGASGATTFLWLVVWGRRLHDLGKSAWFVTVPIGLIVAVTVVALALGGEGLRKAIEYSQNGQGNVGESQAAQFFALLGLLLVIQFAFTIWLGLRPGDPGGNRFGSPPDESARG